MSTDNLHFCFVCVVTSLLPEIVQARFKVGKLGLISSRSAKRCTRRVLQFFYLLVNFGTPRGLLGPQFTNPGAEVQQGLVYQCAKFCPILSTYIRDICCQTRWFRWQRDRQTNENKKPINYKSPIPYGNKMTKKVTHTYSGKLVICPDHPRVQTEIKFYTCRPQ